MTQGARKNASPLRVGIDLDEMMAARLLKPVPVTLKGKTYMVRTDLTSAEVMLYIRLGQADKNEEAYSLLVGAEDAVTLVGVLTDLPKLHQKLVAAEFARASKVLAEYALSEDEIYGSDEQPGESSAS
jgi:hypothetical protein